MANGSDLILRDAYFLITSIFRINNQTFDGFLHAVLKSLYNYEYEVVMNRLRNHDNESPEDVKVLLDRQQVLLKQLPVLPPLLIREIEGTGHVDPQLGRLIRFD